jgi:hypothetical protein
MTYAPNNDNIFDHVHFEVWSMCGKSLRKCGQRNGPDLDDQKLHNWSLRSNPAMFGDFLTNAAIFWAEVYPRSGIYTGFQNRSKTGTAKCRRRPDTSCRYPAS